MRKADALSGMSAKSRVLLTIAVILVVGLAYTQRTLAAQRYVDANSANPVPPFITWQTAARTIQDAVDLAVAGDEILVTNGLYATGRGGMASGSSLTNRACIDKAVAVRSVNGPLVTTIEGYQTTPRWADSAVAVRCAYLADGAVLEGFTLTKGDTRDDGDLILNQSGGGVFCQGPNSLVSRCIIEGNVAYGYGGGAFGGRLENCLIVKNSATNGACGACSNVLVHCTVTGNGLGNGVGGVRGANVFNSIVWQNTGYPENYSSSTFDYSCSTPLPTSGTGNISSDPQFENSTARDWHLRSESPCIDKGNNTFAAGSKDLDGSPRQVGSAVDMGAYEFGPVPPYVLTEPEDYTVVAGQSAVFTAVAEGSAPITYQWWFANQPIPSATSATLTLADVKTAQAGTYYLAITNQFGWTNSRTAVLTVVEPVTHYVDVNSPTPVAPFTSWATAARVIQDAVDAAGAGDHILVTNGVYDLGGKSVVGTLTNRVALYKPVTLRSVNGAAFTTIQGQRADFGTNGPGAIRCAYLTNGASLIGFTLTGGATLSAGEGALTTGGGAWCASNAVISCCVVKGNTAFIAAGGVGGGVLDNCVLFGNSAPSAGAAMWSTLWDCTVMGNSAQEVGGAYICTVWNSILISNTASVSSSTANYLVGSIGYSCTAPLPYGVGNVCFDPRVQDLAGGDLRLRSDSPCIGRGNNAVAVGTTDLDGNPRIYGTVLDMGAYEYQGVFTPSPPSIVLQPTNQTVLAGDNALFAVVGDGTAPLSYQWRFNGTDLFFQTNSLLVITNVQAVDAGGYSVKITNQGGDVVSETAVLSLRAPVIRYVDAGSLNPQPPFSTWATAARTLQDAADLSLAGDEIVATNGIYSSSGRYLINATNRILIPARVAVRSVNGPAFTTILGETNTRCVYLEDFASLVGFTLTRGQANDGGGAFCLSTNAFIANCIIVSNSAAGGSGGGVYGGTLTNCTLTGNSASYGGGAASGSGPYSCALNSCVISSNSASFSGGGTIGCRLNGCLVIGNTAVTGGGVYGLPSVFCLNCTIVGNTASVQGGGIWGTNGMLATSIVYYNKAASSENMGWGARPQILYCCTPQKETYDTTLVTNEPAFVDLAGGNLRLTASSLCINAGANSYAAGAADLDGNPRIHEGVVDIGAYEFQGTFVPIPVTITQQPMSQEAVLGDTVTLTVVAEGTPPLTYQWQFEGINLPGKTDSVLVLANINAGQFGNYTVQVTGRAGPVVSNPAMVSQKGPYLHYVDANSANPTAPFSSWATAARTIQDAVDVASAGDEIVVTNGVYSSGGRVLSGTITNRVAVTNTLVLRSVNGPAFTTILGETNTRCVYLGNAATVAGFTLTGGQADQGGGAFCLSTTALISNCIILSNSASWIGGGAYGGTLTNCTLTGNKASTGGGCGGAPFWGLDTCVLNSCVISSNSATYSGGGVNDCRLNGCLVIGNTARTGGGVYVLANLVCLNTTIAGNTALVEGGGIWTTNGTVANSIVYYNTAPAGSGDLGGFRQPWLTHCCTPQASGWGNITSEPAFVDLAGGNLRLSADSPCINAGTNIYATGATDLDGLPRIVGPAVDIGAYEFQGAGSIRYVDANSPNPAAPFKSWSTAARTIQDAVDVASAGDEIVVTNGVYASGGRVLSGTITNRVAVTNTLALLSVNGPAFTTILGETNTRCVYLGNGASIAGFTITRGQANDGGGAFCLSTNAVIANCIILSNSATGSGGGSYGGTLTNCSLVGNSAFLGGGAASGLESNACALNSCVVSSNSATRGGGVNDCPVNGCLVIGNTAQYGGGIYGLRALSWLTSTIVGNTASLQGGGIWGINGMLATSIIYYNTAHLSENMGWGSMPQILYCCTPKQEPYAPTIITNEPAFVDLAGGNLRLSATSPCINAGANSYAAGATDLEGNPRIHQGVVDIGAYEFQGTFVPIPVTITQQPMSQEAVPGDTVTLTVVAEGAPPLTYQWQFEGANLPGKTDAVLVIANINTGQFGSYTVRVTGRAAPPVLSNPAMVSKKEPNLHYVDANSTNPTTPFSSWATAARAIQDAVDVASAGDEIVVTNGVYSSGGRVISGTITNRVAMTNTLVLRSVNGPAFTTILGETNTRCVYLGNRASVAGFTLTGGQADQGGGAHGGTLTNCILTGNTAYYSGGAAWGSDLYPTVLNFCVISSNSATYSGGGVNDCRLDGCLVIGNTARTGGGVYALANLVCLNSTIVANTALVEGGGIWTTNGTVANSIVYYNTAPAGSEDLSGSRQRWLTYCCTPKNPYDYWETDASTIVTNEPAFVDLAGGNLRLSGDSPCINAGNNLYVTGATDFDGNPRIHWAIADIGAYEYQGAGSTRYVDMNGANPVAPFESWATAARTIQDAVDVASAGDEIVVTNGVYASGGRVISGTITNRVTVTNALVLRSVNGPAFTTILGETNTRCVYLGNGASIAGFTLTGGQADQGGGAFCLSTNAVIANSMILSNIANVRGGGAYLGTLTNCTVTGNTAHSGGGVTEGMLYDCTIRGNSAQFEGGGALWSRLTSCLVISNSAGYGGGVAGCSAANCTLIGNSAQRSGGGAYVAGLNNCLVISNSASSGGGASASFGSHGTPASPYLNNCTVVGNSSGGTVAAILTNCIVYYNEGYNIGRWPPYGRTYNCCTTPLPEPEDGQDNVTNEPLFVSLAAGDFHLQPGSPCIDAGANIFSTGATDLDGQSRIVGSAVDIGAYEFQGAGATLYVDANSANPTAPFKSWRTAARTIQDAVDAASTGEEVLVTNGVYASGGRPFGTLSNRVFVAKAISLRSVNGPRFTVIEGFRDPSADAISRASNSVRCVYLAAGASLSGFTLTNGSTRTPGPVSGNGTEEDGGGVYCESTNAIVSNCILVKNSANLNGGGAYRGTLHNCLILHNGAYWGGGAAEAVLFNCTVVQNGSTSLYGVHKLPYTGPFGAGTFECAAINTIIYDNAFYSWYLPNYYGGTFTNCCTTPVPVDAVGTIESDPLFVNPSGGDFRLTAYSPCINAGANIFATSNTDLDGQPRIVGAAVDIGAYEFQGGTAMSLGDWLAGYGLPSDGSADYVDSDGDGANNWQEWRASTNPTNAASALRLLCPISDGTNILVQWESAPGIGYSLERSASLDEELGFSVIATNLFGPPDTNYPGATSRASFTDTNAAGAPAWLYRVRVKN